MIRFLSNLFRRRELTPVEHARALANEYHRKRRAKIRAKAREMREAMGLPPSPYLEDR